MHLTASPHMKASVAGTGAQHGK